MFISPRIWFSPSGLLVRWGIWPVGASGPLGHLVRKNIWPVGASSPLGHPADDERLALVEHLTVKGRLVRHSNTSGPKGHLRQRERWYIWRGRTHLVHLALIAHLALESASCTSGADGASCTSGAEKRIWYIWHLKVHLVHLLLGGFKSRWRFVDMP